MKLLETLVPAGLNYSLGEIAVTDLARAELHIHGFQRLQEPVIFRKGDGIDIRIRFEEVGRVHVTWERTPEDDA